MFVSAAQTRRSGPVYVNQGCLTEVCRDSGTGQAYCGFMMNIGQEDESSYRLNWRQMVDVCRLGGNINHTGGKPCLLL